MRFFFIPAATRCGRPAAGLAVVVAALLASCLVPAPRGYGLRVATISDCALLACAADCDARREGCYQQCRDENHGHYRCDNFCRDTVLRPCTADCHARDR